MFSFEGVLIFTHQNEILQGVQAVNCLVLEWHKLVTNDEGSYRHVTFSFKVVLHFTCFNKLEVMLLKQKCFVMRVASWTQFLMCKSCTITDVGSRPKWWNSGLERELGDLFLFFHVMQTLFRLNNFQSHVHIFDHFQERSCLDAVTSERWP